MSFTRCRLLAYSHRITTIGSSFGFGLSLLFFLLFQTHFNTFGKWIFHPTKLNREIESNHFKRRRNRLAIFVGNRSVSRT